MASSLRNLLALVLALPLSLNAAEGTRPVEPLTHIGEVRSLGREDAARALPVHVKGVVTWRGARRQIVVQDDTGGCWIYIDEAHRRGLPPVDTATLNAIQVGHVLEIEGLSDPGGYAPGILPAKLRIVGTGALPSPLPMKPARFFNGADANLRVQVRGVVQSFQPAETGWLLELNANPGRFTVEVNPTALVNPQELVDAEVTVTGVATTRFNTRGEITMPRIYSGEGDQLTVEVPAREPFSVRLVPLDRLLPFRAEPTGPHRLRVVGTVTFGLPGKFLYLQEGTSAVRVETHSLEKFEAGDRVEASGFVDMTRNVGKLSEAQVRRLGTDATPAAILIGPEEIIELNRTAMVAGKLAQPHDFDGHLVQFRARLLTVQSAPDPKQSWRRLTLERGEVILSATAYEGDTKSLDALRPGSDLDVTGIVQLEYTPVVAPRLSLMPTGLDILLRDAADVVVVRAPSWWTAGRLLGLMALVALALGAAVVWAWQLRRQVRRKTQELATEMRARRDAAVEFQATLRERNRLAANLHDTLLQSLGAIGFQIGASEAEALVPGREAKPLTHLGVTRRILEHAVQEVRGSVWALRSPLQQGNDLSEALRAMVERLKAGQDVQIELRIDGDLSTVSGFVAGNLMLTAQEAVHNALKHGAPREVVVEIKQSAKPHWLKLVVRDDGKGFTSGKEVGAAQGHFGLVGMRERIERLEGSFRVESVPGRGTMVHVEVPLRSYDNTVA